MEGRSNSMRRKAVGCVQAVVANNNFIVQFEDVQKRYISASPMPCVFLKDDFGQEIDETIFKLSEIGQVELLTVGCDPVVKRDVMFFKVIYLSILHCVFLGGVSMYMV